MPVNQDLDFLESEIDSLKRQNPKCAVEFFNFLVKAIKAKLVYPASSKLPAQFREEFINKATEIIEREGGLQFKITSSSILYNNTPVYESASKNENLAYTFFRDGLIGIDFQTGITADELGRLVDLLAKMMRTLYVDDDLATLLWESNFEHIQYELIEEGLEIETFEYSTDRFKGPGVSGEDIESFFINEGKLTFEEGELESIRRSGNLALRTGAYAKMPDKSHQFLNHISEFTQEEKNQIAEVLASDANFQHTDYLITIIFEILGLEKEIAGYVEVLGFIGKALDSLITTGNFIGASMLLNRMHELSNVLKNLKNPRAEKIDNFLFECASKEKIANLTQTLNNLKDIDIHGLKTYLQQLPWAAIDPLIVSLGELTEFKARLAVCEVLKTLGKDHIELLARGLEDEKWYVVRNIVGILGDLNDSRAINYLKRTIRHPDYRVRHETLTAVAKIHSEESVDFMILALSDPDNKIQLASLRYLAEKKSKRAFMAVENLIKNKNFRNKPPEQIREIIEVYAILGQAKALPYLKSLLSKKLLFGSTTDERLRVYAVGALGKINQPEAIALLNKLASSKDAKVAAAAVRSMGGNKGLK
ncbi:MAG: HEAT repeat domain-containing protein [candidate division Zixibacteria bacterium]|nr:HEAT repeat domain-containing protein [candidate division Zixibacteria bacterium]